MVNIRTFHSAQIPAPIKVTVAPGLVCKRLPRAIDTVGLYVPGGSAPLFSTVLMLAIPARLAGVGRMILTTPPGRDGRVNPAILAAAALCEIDEIYTIGGAQAIGALAYGTRQIPSVCKIFGPGNQWVTTAKQLVAQEAGGPAMDMPAGPSEVMVMADEGADPAFIAADLLSQAEHDPMAQVLLVSLDRALASRVEQQVAAQLENLPRGEIARASLGNARIIIASGRQEACEIINLYAPEHLILNVDDPAAIVTYIRNAGSVFLGPWTPEALGDYASGANHVLPTAGQARTFSGLGVESFMTFMTVQSCTPKALERIGPAVETMAAAEGLDAHRRAVSLRLSARS